MEEGGSGLGSLRKASEILERLLEKGSVRANWTLVERQPSGITDPAKGGEGLLRGLPW